MLNKQARVIMDNQKYQESLSIREKTFNLVGVSIYKLDLKPP